MEPKELANIDADAIAAMLPENCQYPKEQTDLFHTA
jgi:hypothetical protein